MRCAIYARYSSDRQNDRSIEQQVRNCRKRARERGWTITEEHIYADRAVSGTSAEGRDALHQLLRAASKRPRPFDRVLIDDTSRLARNKLDLFQSVEELKDAGVFVHFVSDNIDTEDETTQDVILPVFGIKDALYSRDLAKKTKRGMEDQVLQGYNPGGKTFGYRYEPVLDPSGARDRSTGLTRRLGTAISVDPEQARAIKLIFALYADGYGLKAVAAALNEQGIEPPAAQDKRNRGNPNPTWCPHAIRVMLQNTKYIGDWTWNKNKYVRKRNTGKRVRVERPKDDWVEHKDPKLAIIDQDTWNAVQARFAGNSRRYVRGNPTPRNHYVMSGLLKCGVCGASYVVVRGSNSENIVYGCSFNWQRGHKACPNNVRIRKADIEDRVLTALRERVLNPDVVQILVEKVNEAIEEEQQSAWGERDKIDKRIASVTREIQNLVGYVARTGEVSAAIQQSLKQKEIELAGLNVQFEEYRNRRAAKKIRVEPPRISDWLKRLQDLITTDPLAARQDIAGLIGRLTAMPATQDGKAGVMLIGQPKLEGILGIIGGASNLSNGGGRI